MRPRSRIQTTAPNNAHQLRDYSKSSNRSESPDLTPLEGIALCTYNNETGETFGPYAGYASWMQNHNAYHNWFQTETVPDLLY